MAYFVFSIAAIGVGGRVSDRPIIIFIGLGMTSKKKTCRFKDIVPIEVTPPPPKPN